jgi:ABC-2 type transport system permease protein
MVLENTRHLEDRMVLRLLRILKRYISLELVSIRYCLLREMEFRFNFIITFITIIVIHITNILTYSVIFTRADNIGGWNYSEVIFLIGTGAIIDGFFMSFIFFNITQIPNMINNCELDFLLLKPVNSMFIVSFKNFNLGTFVGNIPTGIGLIIFTLPNLKHTYSIASVFLYVMLIFSGIIILYSMFFIIKCLAFYFIRVDGLDQVFWTVYEFGRRVPGTIYSNIMKAVLTFGLPVLVIVFFPAGLLLDKLGMKEVLISFCISGTLLFLAATMWKISLKRYNSASS